MTMHNIYRVGVWQPLAVSAVVAGLVHGLSVMINAGPLRKVVQILLMSLLYGGVPYATLAIWATWWIGGRPEPEIKRLMFRAPLLMVATFVTVSVATGIVVGQPVPFLAVGVLGAIVIIPLGYAYVGLVMLLREECGPRPV
jgi:hypothetical protein